MVDMKAQLNEDITQVPDEDTLIRSHNAIGHGIVNDIHDIVYVKTVHPETGENIYSASNNYAMADEIEAINRRFLNEDKNYILVGPGRWGSSDRVDPSQGTHFFQNLTSFGVGYFTINDFMGDGIYRQSILNQMPAVTETAHVRHVHFDQPLVVKIDGMKKEGIVMEEEKS